MKWTLAPYLGSAAVEAAFQEDGNWLVPVATFCVEGESTPHHVFLVFPREGPGTIGLTISRMVRYRPFVGRTIRRNLMALVQSVKNAAWYLEEWDLPVCESYRSAKESGGRLWSDTFNVPSAM